MRSAFLAVLSMFRSLQVLGVGGLNVFDTSPVGPLPILLFGSSGPGAGLHIDPGL